MFLKILFLRFLPKPNSPWAYSKEGFIESRYSKLYYSLVDDVLAWHMAEHAKYNMLHQKRQAAKKAQRIIETMRKPTHGSCP